MEMSKKPVTRIAPRRTDPAKFGKGRRVSEESARNIAEAVWSRYPQTRNGVSRVTDPDALTQIIWEECGRQVRGHKNLSLVESCLCDI